MTDNSPDEAATPSNDDKTGHPRDDDAEVAASASSLPSRALCGSYSVVSLGGVCLFFLPWLRLSCVDVTMVSQTGYELTIGKANLNENFEQDLNRKFAEELGDVPATRGRRVASRDTQSQRARQARKEAAEQTSPTPYLALLPAGLLFAGAFGFIGVLSNRRVRPIVPLIGAALAACAAAASVAIDFQLEAELSRTEGDKAMTVIAEFIDIERTWACDGIAVAAVSVLVLVLVDFGWWCAQNRVRNKQPGDAR